MSKKECVCQCGHHYQVNAYDGTNLRCPKCGRLNSIPSKEMDPTKRQDFEDFVEATYEIMGEGVEGGCPFSGAR